MASPLRLNLLHLELDMNVHVRLFIHLCEYLAIIAVVGLSHDIKGLHLVASIRETTMLLIDLPTSKRNVFAYPGVI